MAALAVALSKTTHKFKELGSTSWLLATVTVYTVGPAAVSDLMVAFPCFKAEGDKHNMLHDPSEECYSKETLMLSSSVGLCLYIGVTVYVLGVAFWQRKDIIKHPDQHENQLVQSTYTAFGFL